MESRRIAGAALLVALLSLSGAGPLRAYCLIRGTLGGGPGGREDCCTQDISQWRPENLPVPMWINEDTDPDLWDGIRESFAIWTAIPSSYFAVVDSGFTPINDVAPWDGVNIVSFSNDTGQFPPGSNTIAFTSGDWGTNVGSDETITGFDVIFNDVGFDFGNPPGPQEFSVIGITNHELGHAWAIAHCWEGGPPGCGPNCPASTMYGYSSQPDVVSESLELDDMGAATLAYPRWLVRGTVRVAGTGDPIPGAQLTTTAPVVQDTLIFGTLPDPLPGNGSACGTTTLPFPANADGQFEFAAMEPDFRITAYQVGFSPDSISVTFTGIDTLRVHIDLGPTALSSITGTLTDGTSGDGIAATLVLMENGEPGDSTVSDPGTGAFSFDGVPISFPPYLTYTGLEIHADIPYPGTTVIDQEIEVSEGAPAVVDLTLEAADVILLDDDDGASYEDYYTTAIVGAGRTYRHYDAAAEGESGVDVLKRFPPSSKAVWFTGDAETGTLTETEQDSLTAFLGRGGKLLLTGQNIAEELDAAGSLFLSDVLHTGHAENVAFFMARGVYGNPVTGYLGNFFTTGSGGANNQTSRDRLVVDPPAEEIIFYVTNPVDLTPQGTAALAVEGPGGSKAVLMGFGLESLNAVGDPTRASREETMTAVLNWFDGITGIGDGNGPGGGAVLPRAFALGQNYPNPFNPSTTIRYAIPEGPAGAASSGAVPVRLTLYDARGRMVRTLVDREEKPGAYTVHWDGRDDRDRTLGSGVYFYRLRAGDRDLTRKMTIVR